jgi:hypothetical protein
LEWLEITGCLKEILSVASIVGALGEATKIVDWLAGGGRR